MAEGKPGACAMFCLALKQLKSALIMEAVGTMLFVFISAGAVVSTGNVAFGEMSPARLASISLAGTARKAAARGTLHGARVCHSRGDRSR